MLRVRTAFPLAPLSLLLFALGPFGSRPAAAEEPPPDDRKPLAEVVDKPDEWLKPLLGKPPGDREGGGGGTCYVAQCDQDVYCLPNTNSACLVQVFDETRWRICIQATFNKTYAIGPVDLKRTATSPWRRIIYKASPAEIFTSYHSGDPHFYDTRFSDGSNWRRDVNNDDAGPNGVPIALSQDGFAHPTIVAECHDRGVAWMCKGPTTSYVRRGKELLLWGVGDAGNYDYVIQYGFQDDGTITFKTGATGYNSPVQPDVAHNHDVIWRIDIDLNGPAGDTPRLGRHIEPLSASIDPFHIQANDLEAIFGHGHEGSTTWKDIEFTTLLVEDQATNALKSPMGYELQPERTGSSRHYGLAPPLDCTETWSQRDFWVTRWHANENNAWAEPWKCPDDYLSTYPNGESIINQDLVLWYLASAHHDPIDEDRAPNLAWGVTRMHWFGFQLEPHNYFDHNPLGGLEVCP